MRELYLVDEESTETFLVLRDAEGVHYRMARTELESEPSLVDEPLDAEVVDVVLEEPDSLFATPLSLRPNEIQARIRAGATQRELAAEMGVAESRIEPYAHPVVLERFQIAEAAKQSHPLREGGPAKLTLFEILATALAARGNSLTTAEWDATREPGDDWVVHVRWKTGLSENEGLWSLKRSMGSAATTEARNAVAADLTDPDFVQPVRSLTAVEPQYELEELDDPAGESDDSVVEGDFLRHPDENDHPQQRRRKAVTPHWEDVLLGVRTNTKRPRK
ncbi:DUF3071 domain-containing protein [Corynebacterium qintianiae]|uniref:DUF3071 domain-containing protein n=1 Tax=Corynebacterium qintianiae TaxID=2709392 RepID=A0A7T0KN84_9CORY|nr:septation protein SepH [Corynebacterium qintianiae]QPK83780.1 DUF3071 domain-containing protein [Corynebacterium qintianiae]